MDKKHFITRLNHRELDRTNTPGGGSDKKPGFTLTGEELVARSKDLVSELESLNQEWDDYHLPNISKPVVVDISRNAKSKSRQSDIINLIKEENELVKLGMVSEYSMLIKIDNLNQLNSFKSKLDGQNIVLNDVVISSIEDIERYEPKIVKNKSSSKYKIKFLNFFDDEMNKIIFDSVITKLEEKKVNYEIENFRSQSIIVINKAQLDKLEFLKNTPIHSVEPLLETNIKLDNTIIPEVSDSNLLKYNDTNFYPTIGLLDTGVENNQYTKDWVSRGNGVRYQDSELNTNHGTFIASLLIYGDVLNSYNDHDVKGCKIIDVPVVPVEPISEAELLRNIEQGIKSNPNVKIWNLSVSLSGSIDDDSFSFFASELDKLQKYYNIIIVKSAGNDSAFSQGNEAGKISIGAETVRGITVGSSIRDTDDYEVYVKDNPAPYSRIGRGPANIIKPEIVHYGGDIHSKVLAPKTASDYLVAGETGYTSLNSLTKEMVGTSFSTPKVAKNLSELDHYINEDFNPLLLKALTIHSANYGESTLKDSEDRVTSLGFGKPDRASEIIREDNTASTLIFNGVLKKSRRIDIMDFPYPDVLIKEGHYTGHVKITAVIDPYLEQQMGDEYCQSNIDLKFGTYDQKVDYTEEDFLYKFNSRGRLDSENYLTGRHFSKRKINRNESLLNERLQLKYNNKYYPVKKYEFNIEELTDSNIKTLSSDRNWFLFFEGQYRDFIEDYANRSHSQLELPYCVIVTISDEDNSVDVHNSMLQKLELYNFSYNEISSQINVEINLNE